MQDALGILPEDVLNFRESQETEFDHISWEHAIHKGAEALVGQGTLADEVFELYIEPRTFTFAGITYSFLNLGFAKVIDGIPSENLQKNSSAPSAIIGAVKNALWDKVKEYQFDALTLIASTDIRKRMRTYDHIARSGWANKNLQTVLSNVKLADGSEAVILLSPEIARNPVLEEFKKYLASLKK